MIGQGQSARDPVVALVRHVQSVLTTRALDREQRRDIALGRNLTGRIGTEQAAAFEALIGIATAALDLISARRERDRLIAAGRTPRAQPLGRRIAAIEETILHMVQVITEPAAPVQRIAKKAAPASRRDRNTLRDQADHDARQLAPLVEQAREAGCLTYVAIAQFFNAKRISSIGKSSTWTAAQVASLRRRLERLGLTPNGARQLQVRVRVRRSLVGAAEPAAAPQEQP
jgi:hypothetical protein